jgi:uncharacterized protein (DUF2236 family)
VSEVGSTARPARDTAPAARRGDPGLFGPGSVTWRVHAEQILWVGGLRALYLQALQPDTVRGVFTHSNYQADPWGRLMRTAGYVGVVTYGARANAEAAGARVRKLHARLGVADAHLLRWVHCCEVGSFLEAYQRAGGGLSAADADGYLAEQVRAAELVGLDPATVPASVADLDAYTESMRPELAASKEAREVARFLLAPPMPARVRLLTPAAPTWAAVSALAFALQPGWARRLYGLPPLPLTDLATTAAMRALRASLTLLPDQYRTGPHLRDARERTGAA